MATVVVGGRGSALSAETIYNIAYGLSTLQLDSSALEKISQSSSRSSLSVDKISPPGENASEENGPSLSKVESRAALVVLANKLLQSHARMRSVIPIFIEYVLKKDIALDLPASSDKAVARAVAGAIYSFDGDFSAFRVSRDDFWVSAEEMDVMESSFAATVGISALIVYSSSALAVVADAVAGLSCEAMQINSQAFDLEPSSEGFSNKLETDVACDMRTLLFGSRLVSPKNLGFDGDSAFFSIPFVHGCFREDIKLAQNKIRIEANSMVFGNSPSRSKQNTGDTMQLQALKKVILSIAMSLQAIGKNSFRRAECNMQVYNSLEADVKLSEKSFQNCPGTGDLKERVELIFRKAVIENDSNGVFVTSQVYGLLQESRAVLALEASCALSLLGLREKLVAIGTSKQKPPGEKENTNDGFSAVENSLKPQENKGKQRGEKKKKGNQDIVMGKGTGMVRQLVIQIVQRRILGENTHINVSPETWAQELESYFDPKDPEFQMLLETMKTILESNEIRRLPKIPKGTRDFKPEQMAIREKAFGIIAGVFKRHGAVAIDTPVFELRETLMGKYGEDSKLIYDLADQGGEICSLRYDLTVPFARYLAMYSISNLKRYHIARVYRRDNPSKGRYREFYQCDFDIAGQYASMVPDFEVIKVLTELLDELDIGDYEVKLNHRKLLDGMLEICGVPKEKFRTICSAIDKLDKQAWEQVRKEMVEEKGLTPETADSIGSFVLKKGRPLEMLAKLKQKDSPFLKHDSSVLALQELETLFNYLNQSNCLDKISFDLSLARGLDYYTGVIYEAVFKGTTQVGSIAAGGRYDNLVGMFSGKQVPAVGVSLGIERVFTIMEQQEQELKKVTRATQTEVLAVVLGDDMGVAIKLVSELWAGKLKAEFALTSIKKIMKQIQYALESGIPYMLIMGENELKNGLIQLKDIRANQQDEVPRDKIVEELKQRLNGSNQSAVQTVVQ
ncbi:hypothetical protein SUGI_0457460 [Cryptomeria japonica]|nr:hypothetical protein SUGI_0457460 [Cryptomeria japonica]